MDGKCLSDIISIRNEYDINAFLLSSPLNNKIIETPVSIQFNSTTNYIFQNDQTVENQHLSKRFNKNGSL